MSGCLVLRYDDRLFTPILGSDIFSGAKVGHRNLQRRNKVALSYMLSDTSNLIPCCLVRTPPSETLLLPTNIPEMRLIKKITSATSRASCIVNLSGHEKQRAISLHHTARYVLVTGKCLQNDRFEESVERAAREGKDMGHTLSVVEKAGNLTIADEDVLRQQLAEMEEAEEKEQATDRAIENKIKVSTTCHSM